VPAGLVRNEVHKIMGSLSRRKLTPLRELGERNASGVETLVNKTFYCDYGKFESDNPLDKQCLGDPDMHQDMDYYGHCIDSRPSPHDFLHYMMDIDLQCSEVLNENGTDIVKCTDLKGMGEEQDLFSHCEVEDSFVRGSCYYVCLSGRPVSRCEMQFDPNNEHLMRHEAIKKCEWNSKCVNETVEINRVVCTGWDDQLRHPNQQSDGQIFDRSQESRFAVSPLSEEASFDQHSHQQSTSGLPPAISSELTGYRVAVGILASVLILTFSFAIVYICLKRKGRATGFPTSPSGNAIVVGRPHTCLHEVENGYCHHDEAATVAAPVQPVQKV